MAQPESVKRFLRSKKNIKGCFAVWKVVNSWKKLKTVANISRSIRMKVQLEGVVNSKYSLSEKNMKIKRKFSTKA